MLNQGMITGISYYSGRFEGYSVRNGERKIFISNIPDYASLLSVFDHMDESYTKGEYLGEFRLKDIGAYINSHTEISR